MFPLFSYFAQLPEYGKREFLRKIKLFTKKKKTEIFLQDPRLLFVLINSDCWKSSSESCCFMTLYDNCFLQTPIPELHASFKTKTKAKRPLSAIRQHLLNSWMTKLPQLCGSFLVAYWLWWLRIITCSNSQPKQKHSTPRSFVHLAIIKS